MGVGEVWEEGGHDGTSRSLTILTEKDKNAANNGKCLPHCLFYDTQLSLCPFTHSQVFENL